MMKLVVGVGAATLMLTVITLSPAGGFKSKATFTPYIPIAPQLTPRLDFFSLEYFPCWVSGFLT